MVVLNRFTTLLSADLHAVLDKLEDPFASLKLAVREMECALADADRNLEARRRTAEILQRQQRECEEQIAALQQQLDACFESEEDTLAKSVLRNKLLKEKRLAAFGKTFAENEQCIRQEEKSLRENRQKLSAMREKLALLTQQNDPQADSDLRSDCGDAELSDEEVEVAFLQEKRRRAHQ